MPRRGELQAGTYKKKEYRVTCLWPKPVEARFLIAERKEKRCKKTKKKGV
jgi:hypothetical protein